MHELVVENVSDCSKSSHEGETMPSSDESSDSKVASPSSCPDECQELADEKKDKIGKTLQEGNTSSHYPSIACHTQHSAMSDITADCSLFGEEKDLQKEIDALKFIVSKSSYFSSEEIYKRLEQLEAVAKTQQRKKDATKSRSTSMRSGREGRRKPRPASDPPAKSLESKETVGRKAPRIPRRIDRAVSAPNLGERPLKNKSDRLQRRTLSADNVQKSSLKNLVQQKVDPVETALSRTKRRTSRKSRPVSISTNLAGQLNERFEDPVPCSSSSPLLKQSKRTSKAVDPPTKQEEEVSEVKKKQRSRSRLTSMKIQASKVFKGRRIMGQ